MPPHPDREMLPISPTLALIFRKMLGKMPHMETGGTNGMDAHPPHLPSCAAARPEPARDRRLPARHSPAQLLIRKSAPMPRLASQQGEMQHNAAQCNTEFVFRSPSFTAREQLPPAHLLFVLFVPLL